MRCQSCGSERVLELMAKCPDGYRGWMGTDYEFDSPAVKGIMDGEDVCPKICLDCGQCQGEWPVVFHEADERYVAEPPPATHATVREWLDAVREHTCEGKAIMVADLPPMRIGYVCTGCNKWFGIKLSDFRKTVNDATDDAEALVALKRSLVTAEGRRELADAFSGDDGQGGSGADS